MNLKKTKLRLGKRRGKPQIVFLSSLSHRKCGIAKFTRDLTHSADELFGKDIDFKRVAITDEEEEKCSPTRDFVYKISKFRERNYRDCAKFLNQDADIKLINIQHEFGIFGGEMGSYLLAFLAEIIKPVFITFHTVIPGPNKELRSLLKKIGGKVKKVVVMTERSRNLLLKEYGFPKNKVSVIPHGIPSFPYEDDNEPVKQNLGLGGRTLLFTHGFLSRNKGIEYVLDALPGVTKRFPRALYLLAGRTHPNVKRQEGESYRLSLLKKIKELGIQKNVKFVNKYITTDNLVDYLKACDIYVSTSLDPRQAVSGTLAYALGSGRPVVSTAFAHSKEELKKCAGILVEPRNSKSYEKALITLLGDKKLGKTMGMSCYFKTRNMTWQNVALSYGRISSEYVPGVGRSLVLPPVILTHLFRMTDDFGLLQFAKLTKPLKKSGYTVDDNARALVVTGMYYLKHKEKAVLNHLKIYLNFLKYALDDSTGHFRNYVNFNRSFNKRRNEKESHENPTSRALYALAKTMTASELPKNIRLRALRILRKSLSHRPRFTHSRSTAFYLKALYFFLSVENKNKRLSKELVKYADALCARYRKHSSANWLWFEDALTYSNGIIPESLFLAYRTTGLKKYLDIANKTAEFLIQHSFKKGFCAPIGQKYWFRKGKKRSYYDQQPEEVAALVEMLDTSYGISRDKEYRKLMVGAYNWFLGNNTLEQVVCDFKTGGCYDGIGEKEVNLNQGAESTLSYLTTRLIVSRR